MQSDQFHFPLKLDRVSLANFRVLLAKYVSSANSTYAHSTIPTTAVASSSFTLLTGSLDFSSGIIYAAGTGKFTVPSAGKYMVLAAMGWSAVSGNAQALIYKNGTAFNYAYSNGAATTAYNDILDLAAGDYLQLYAFQTSGSTTHVGANPTWIAISKIA